LEDLYIVDQKESSTRKKKNKSRAGLKSANAEDNKGVRLAGVVKG